MIPDRYSTSAPAFGTTLGRLVEVVREQLGIAAEPQWGSMPERQWDTDTWVADPSEIRAHLGWKPAFELEEGLRAFASWLMSEPGVRHRYETTLTPPR